MTLKGTTPRTLRFDDLARNDDPTRASEQLVVTVDGQLFYQVLQALPYLVHYPYECTEQTLNRFVSTGIVSSVYGHYPAVEKLAQRMSQRKTALETFDAIDPNRKLAFEETPWLVEAHGGPNDDVINTLSPANAKAERESALTKLVRSQLGNGSFPWWSGGPSSPYMTLTVAYGFAKASEFNVPVPKETLQRAWRYLATYYRSDLLPSMHKGHAPVDLLTFLNFVASSYPDPTYVGAALTDDERKEILAYSFEHWRAHSPYLKAMLALTLKRAGRVADARKVFASVMDSAKTTEDAGTFWAREDRSWLWYNDTIESHAFALRTLLELSPKDKRLEGLVQWLFLNKKLNQWKSTRATAEVIYSLVKYLEHEGQLGQRESVSVRIDQAQRTFDFSPDAYDGAKRQWTLPGEQVTARSAEIDVRKSTPGMAFASATWLFASDKLPTQESGDLFHVSRAYFLRQPQGREFVLKPLTDKMVLSVGDEVEVQLAISAKSPAEFIHLRDPRAAGLEPVSTQSQYRYRLGLGWYEEVRDSGTNFFFDAFPKGEYTLSYRLRANMAGTFRVGPATLQSIYAPEFTAYSAGIPLHIQSARAPR